MSRVRQGPAFRGRVFCSVWRMLFPGPGTLSLETTPPVSPVGRKTAAQQGRAGKDTWGLGVEEWKHYLLSHVRLLAPPSTGFSRENNCTGQPFPSPGDLPEPGTEPTSPALQADSSPSKPRGKPWFLSDFVAPPRSVTPPLSSLPSSRGNHCCLFPELLSLWRRSWLYLFLVQDSAFLVLLVLLPLAHLLSILLLEMLLLWPLTASPVLLGLCLGSGHFPESYWGFRGTRVRYSVISSPFSLGNPVLTFCLISFILFFQFTNSTFVSLYCLTFPLSYFQEFHSVLFQVCYFLCLF